jgi:hypothetical protein
MLVVTFVTKGCGMPHSVATEMEAVLKRVHKAIAIVATGLGLMKAPLTSAENCPANCPLAPVV